MTDEELIARLREPYLYKGAIRRIELERLAADRIEALTARLAAAEGVVEALRAQRDREYNPFEPDNQSNDYKRVCAALAAWEQATTPEP